MKRLRHPIRAIREPFGTAGLIVACMALVLATTGAAFAAGGLTKSQEKQVVKIAKKYAGKPGATGPAGPAGPAGKNGNDGSNGSNGSNGESVTISSAGNTECPEGGTKFSNATGSGHACNGAAGTTGYTETLPSGKTETGQWAFAVENPAEGGTERVALSFPIQLAATVTPHLIGEGEGEGEAHQHLPAGCKGNVASPEAEAGNLCIFTFSKSSAHLIAFFDGGTGSTTATGLTGDTMLFGTEKVENIPPFVETAQALGTWAVTAH